MTLGGKRSITVRANALTVMLILIYLLKPNNIIIMAFATGCMYPFCEACNNIEKGEQKWKRQ